MPPSPASPSPDFDVLVDAARQAQRWRAFESEPRPGGSDAPASAAPVEPAEAERLVWRALARLPEWHVIVLVPPGEPDAPSASGADGSGSEVIPPTARPNLVAWPVQPAAGVFTDADRARAYAIEHGLLAAHDGPTPDGWGALNRGVRVLACPARTVVGFLHARMFGRGGVVVNPGPHAFAAPLELVEALLATPTPAAPDAVLPEVPESPEIGVVTKRPARRAVSKTTAAKKTGSKKTAGKQTAARSAPAGPAVEKARAPKTTARKKGVRRTASKAASTATPNAKAKPVVGSSPTSSARSSATPSTPPSPKTVISKKVVVKKPARASAAKRSASRSTSKKR